MAPDIATRRCSRPLLWEGKPDLFEHSTGSRGNCISRVETDSYSSMAQHVATLRPGPTVRSKLQRLARAAAYLKAIHTRAGAGLSNSDGGGGFYWFWHTLALFQSVTLARVCRRKVCTRIASSNEIIRRHWDPSWSENSPRHWTHLVCRARAARLTLQSSCYSPSSSSSLRSFVIHVSSWSVLVSPRYFRCDTAGRAHHDDRVVNLV